MKFMLRSPAFDDGESIPRAYTCDGEGMPTPLAWTDAPDGTVALALVMDDPDAPSGTFTHWILTDIPPDVRALDTPRAGTAGTNDFGRRGYGGPCPPRGHGPHRYRFHLHALADRLDLRPGFDRPTLDAALAGRVLATARLTGRYERP